MLKLMQSDKDIIGPVNVGNPVEFSMLELATKVLAITGSRSTITHAPLPQDDPRQRKPDISLARSKLDWEPRTPLDDGLRETVAYFRQLLRDR